MTLRNPDRYTPVITWSLIGICVAIWLGELAIPGFVNDIALSAAAGKAEPWRFLTSAFAHSTNITHIGFNMFALWSLGRVLERFLGRARYLATYLLAALGGGVLFAVMATPSETGTALTPGWFDGVVGASGAIFGLFGTLLVVQRRLGGSTRSLWLVLALNAALVFFIPDIAWQAHVGGFIIGMLCGVVFFEDVKRVQRGHNAVTWWLLGAMAVLMIAVLIGKYAVTVAPA